MKVGDIVPTTSIRAIYDGGGLTSVFYKANSGRRMVFMLLGDESKDESDRLDPEAVMRKLGWVPATDIEGKS